MSRSGSICDDKCYSEDAVDSVLGRLQPEMAAKEAKFSQREHDHMDLALKAAATALDTDEVRLVLHIFFIFAFRCRWVASLCTCQPTRCSLLLGTRPMSLAMSGVS
jgi:hypothetical protein